MSRAMKQSRTDALIRPSASALIEQEMLMGRKSSQDWMTTGFSLWKLGAEANSVIMLRMARFAIGGPSAHKEAQLMISEKIEAAAELQMRLMTGTLGATPLSGTRKAISHYQRKVSANKKRLSSVKGR